MLKFLLSLGFIVFFTGMVWASEYVLVFAGAGMRVPLNEIGKQFEAKYGIKVVYDYEGSGRLGNKILAGQRPDTFIPGSEKWARTLQKKGYIKKYAPIAYHIPVIITPLDSVKVNSLQDFMKKDVRLVLGDAKACAIGRVGNRIFKKAGLDETKMHVVARGVTVKQLVHWIEGKNADASIVWHADAVESGRVRIIPIPKEVNCIAQIPVCTMKQPYHPKLAAKYIDYLLTEGKVIFKKYGFKIAE